MFKPKKERKEDIVFTFRGINYGYNKILKHHFANNGMVTIYISAKKYRNVLNEYGNYLLNT